MEPYSVLDVAKYVIQISEPLSNLKLQKLLYYVQGWHLGLKDEPLFAEQIEAWVHGPVVPAVFRKYSQHGWQTIPKPASLVSFPSTQAKHIRDVIGAYGRFSALQLERLSHTERPWLGARGDLPESTPSKVVISHDSLRDFFASKAKA